MAAASTSQPRHAINYPQLAAPYTPKPSLELAAYSFAKGAGAGLLVSAVQNALDSHSRGAAGVLSRTGGTIGLFGAMAGTFTFVDSVTANTRQTDDALNGVAGGCAAGFLAGVRARSLPIAVGTCALLGAAVGVLDVAGGKLSGDGREFDSLDAKEERRRAFFKPRKEVVAVTAEE